jgi:nucleoid DNA-binding protein
MSRVNQSDLVKRLALEFEIPVARAKKMVDFFIEQISEELIKGNPVSLWRFGTFRRGEPYIRPNCRLGNGGVAHYKPRIRLATSTRLRRRL